MVIYISAWCTVNESTPQPLLMLTTFSCVPFFHVSPTAYRTQAELGLKFGSQTYHRMQRGAKCHPQSQTTCSHPGHGLRDTTLLRGMFWGFGAYQLLPMSLSSMQHTWVRENLMVRQFNGSTAHLRQFELKNNHLWQHFQLIIPIVQVLIWQFWYRCSELLCMGEIYCGEWEERISPYAVERNLIHYLTRSFELDGPEHRSK